MLLSQAIEPFLEELLMLRVLLSNRVRCATTVIRRYCALAILHKHQATATFYPIKEMQLLLWYYSVCVVIHCLNLCEYIFNLSTLLLLFLSCLLPSNVP